jgi:uncharacterized membrane protein YqiK
MKTEQAWMAETLWLVMVVVLMMIIIIMTMQFFIDSSWALIARSVQLLTTGWTVLGSNPSGEGVARFAAPVQTGPGAHPASCTVGTGSLHGVKRPGRDDHQPPSSA